MIKGLEYLNNNYIGCDKLYIRGDSEVVLRQLDGQYNVNSDNIRPYYNDAIEKLEEVDCDVTHYRHVPRHKNWEADQLANDAIERGY